MTVNVRLQGGPHDGERQRDLLESQCGPLIYVERCRHCGGHWYAAPVDGAEIYRRDKEDDKGWLIYVFSDARLSPKAETDERELVPAGGIPEDDQLEPA